MNLIEKTTGKKLDGIIELVKENDFEQLRKRKKFGFDWSEEKGNQVYKISLKTGDEILGLASIVDIPKELRLHINLIESAQNQKGKSKTILNIPGCLIGYICRLSFKKGYGGFVSLTPKTQLKKYYSKNYGFEEMGFQMGVFGEKSSLIIKKYLEDEEI